MYPFINGIRHVWGKSMAWVPIAVIRHIAAEIMKCRIILYGLKSLLLVIFVSL